MKQKGAGLYGFDARPYRRSWHVLTADLCVEAFMMYLPPHLRKEWRSLTASARHGLSLLSFWVGRQASAFRPRSFSELQSRVDPVKLTAKNGICGLALSSPDGISTSSGPLSRSIPAPHNNRVRVWKRSAPRSYNHGYTNSA